MGFCWFVVAGDGVVLGLWWLTVDSRWWSR